MASSAGAGKNFTQPPGLAARCGVLSEEDSEFLAGIKKNAINAGEDDRRETPQPRDSTLD
jgi:hypothetical protein